MNDQPPDFDDLFDPDGEVKVTPDTNKPEPGTRSELTDADFKQPATHTIYNTNARTGAEFNIFFKNDGGFKCHLKLHGAFGLPLLQNQVPAIVDFLVSNGYTPEHAQAPTGAPATREDLPQDGTASKTFCTIHECEMKRWESADGKQVWYSHKIDGTDDWCKGK